MFKEIISKVQMYRKISENSKGFNIRLARYTSKMQHMNYGIQFRNAKICFTFVM